MLWTARQGDMYRVRPGLLRDDPRGHERRRKVQHVVRDIQQGDTLDRVQAFLGHLGIPSRNLIKDELRYIEIESNPPRAPPFRSNLLMGCNQQITAWVCRQIAGDRGFEIYRAFHRQQLCSAARENAIPTENIQISTPRPCRGLGRGISRDGPRRVLGPLSSQFQGRRLRQSRFDRTSSAALRIYPRILLRLSEPDSACPPPCKALFTSFKLDYTFPMAIVKCLQQPT